MNDDSHQENGEPELPSISQSPFVSVRNRETNDPLPIDRPDWIYFNQIPEMSLRELVPVSMDITALGIDEIAVGYRQTEQYRKIEREHRTRLGVALHWFAPEALECLGDEHALDEALRTMVNAHEFVAWARDRGWTLPLEWQPPAPASSTSAGWPWGAHDTKLLRILAAAAKHWWSNYDPSAPELAPTIDQVRDWLMEQNKRDPKFSTTQASAIASILKHDGVPPGPRKKSGRRPLS